LLLFINYTKTEVDLVGLLKGWLHAHDLRKGLLGMLEGAIAVVEDTNAVPELGLLLIVSLVRIRGLLGMMFTFGSDRWYSAC
jgi:hypothetical protein